MNRWIGALILSAWLALPAGVLSQNKEKAAGPQNQSFGQVKIMGGLGIAQDVGMTRNSYWHLSAGWFVLLLDFSTGPGFSFNKYIGMYIRAHGIYMISPMGGSALVPGMEPGIRFNFSDRLVIELGMVLVPGIEGEIAQFPGLPNVGILLPLDWLDLFD